MKKQFSLATIFLVVFIDLLGVSLILPVLTPLLLGAHGILPAADTYGERTLILGFLTAMYPFAQFFGSPILGALSDRYGRKKVLLVSQAGSFIGYIFFGFGVLWMNVPLLFVSRVVAGFTGGNVTVATSAIADVTGKKERAKYFGYIVMAFGLGIILGPYIGGKLSDPTLVSWFNGATPFFFAALLTAANMFMVVTRFTETLKTKIKTKVSLGTGIRNIAQAFALPDVRAMFIVIFLLAFGLNFFTQFFQVYLFEHFGYSESMIGNLFAYVGVCLALTLGLVNPWLVKRVDSTRILFVSILGLALAFPLLLFPQALVPLLAALFLVAFFEGVTQPNQTAVVSLLADEDSQGEILGINNSIQALAQAIPPILAGVLASLDPGLPTLVAGGVTLLAWLVYLVFYRKTRHEIFHEI